ncbi:YjjG family noncanonical pyrimidine nucleotidase [bacterium]|nr:YjjG family noncanonical pyrimidine nucleotidase [bacterium]
MAYNLFLFDLDDTLLDFKESEKLSFYSTLKSLNIDTALDPIFESYQRENRALWKLFEEGKTSKDHLKIERFRKTFNLHKIDINPELASARYLDMLPENVVLIDHAVEICEWLKDKGEIGIITNGIHYTQTHRIKNSKIAPFISFVCVSEECGFAKPDVRFFEYSSKMVKNFSKNSAIVIGDRLETDVLGAHNYGLDACWFNPQKLSNTMQIQPKYEISHLSELKGIFK